ncbi:MAG: arginine--tRNA ligase [Candidatus Aenigmarchaeota archaeon]|nr:arginine--tRNA ligase [Candidatus Aenigmarchaeota archaeon]
MYSHEKIRDAIQKSLIPFDEDPVIEEPPEGMGDFAFPCFNLSKKTRKSPVAIANEIAGKIRPSYVERTEAKGPYVNFFVDWAPLFKAIHSECKGGFSGKLGNGTALIEHTSINPNASPHVGRARNAIIGDSIARLLRYAGYQTEVHYFVNDVGKQIALLVYECGRRRADFSFGDLLGIYIDASRELENDPTLEKEIFELLKKFENGDSETVEKFRKVVDVCVSGQSKILKKIGASYDFFDYESAYLQGGEVKKALLALEKTGKVFVDEEGRKVIDLRDYMKESPYLVITRSDGTSLYPLRDIAYSIYKIGKVKDSNVLVLGEDQKLYFQQIASAMRLLGAEPPKVVHYSFVLLPTGKMSTRKGEVVLLEDFLSEAAEEAKKGIDERHSELPEEEKSKRAASIAAAAVRYSIVKVGPEKNVMFSMKDAIRLEGDTGPYLQYTYARALSILAKEKPGPFDASFIRDEREISLIRQLAKFPGVAKDSIREFRPHYVAVYSYDLCEKFNSFYQSVRVLQSQGPEKMARLAIVESFCSILKDCLLILGIDAMEEM